MKKLLGGLSCGHDAGMFTYRRRVQFYETDLMGIVHHSNYLRFFEEARVAWGHHHKLIDFADPRTAAHFAVLGTRVQHLKPCRFGDQLAIELEVKSKGIRFFFQYRIRGADDEIVCVGTSDHVPLNEKLQPKKLDVPTRRLMEKSAWTETWLLNS